MQHLIQYSPIIFMIVFVYFVILLPEKKRKKKYHDLLQNLKVNDEIMTRGGIIGKIINIQGNTLVLQTGPDKVRIKLDRTGVVNLLSELQTGSGTIKPKEEKKEA